MILLFLLVPIKYGMNGSESFSHNCICQEVGTQRVSQA